MFFTEVFYFSSQIIARFLPNTFMFGLFLGATISVFMTLSFCLFLSNFVLFCRRKCFLFLWSDRKSKQTEASTCQEVQIILKSFSVK